MTKNHDRNHERDQAERHGGGHDGDGAKPPVRVTPSTRVSVAFPFSQIKVQDPAELREVVDSLTSAVERLEAAIDRLEAGAGRP
ncbi:MAG TPA: hypothetical protein VMT43_04355 [Acidimicrobiales bacterium]|nr:hypothetical protein [Acidimicrobiales bacterium]